MEVIRRGEKNTGRTVTDFIGVTVRRALRYTIKEDGCMAQHSALGFLFQEAANLIPLSLLILSHPSSLRLGLLDALMTLGLSALPTSF